MPKGSWDSYIQSFTVIYLVTYLVQISIEVKLASTSNDAPPVSIKGHQHICSIVVLHDMDLRKSLTVACTLAGCVAAYG